MVEIQLSTTSRQTVRSSRQTFIIERIRSFNIFQSYPSSTEEYDIKNELISTRLFLLLLIITAFILLVYTSQIDVTQTITVAEPEFNRFQSLLKQYSKTLNCPCDNIAIPQKTFISLYPKFHQICSSDFVTSKWFAHISAAADIYISKDFSHIGGPFFQGLATFCDLAKASVSSSLRTLESTNFIASTVLSEEVFIQETQQIISTFKSKVVEAFIQPLNMDQAMTHANSLMSGLFTNGAIEVVKFLLPDIMAYMRYESYNNRTCNCYVTSSCRAPLTRQKSNSSVVFTIPGLYIGCYLIEAIRNSSLECFYNQSCLKQVQLALQSPMPFNATVLDPSETQFLVNSTIDTLLQQAMIEQWTQNMSWSNFYQQCKPVSCTYSFTNKYNIWYMITTIIGLMGGLVKVLQFLVPLGVKCIRKRFYHPMTRSVSSSHSESEAEPWWRKLSNFNLFQTVPATINVTEIRKQIISTRLFIYLFIFFLIFFLTYLSSDNLTTSPQILSPSYDQFLILDSQRNEYSVACPCSSISVKYEDIFQISFLLHPICSSNFVQSIWLNAPGIYFDSIPSDFSGAGSPIFQTLAAFCHLSKIHITSNLENLYLTRMITSEALGEDEFQARVNTIYNLFVTSMTNLFLRSLNLTSRLNRANGIVSVQGTNFYPYGGGTIHLGGVQNSSSFNFLYRPHQNCFCYPSTYCPMSITVYNLNYDPIEEIQLYLGCLPDEGVRKSSIQSFYKQSLVNEMTRAYGLPSGTIKALNASELIQFKAKALVEEILSKMMVNQWNMTSFHKKYYAVCKPDVCTYTIRTRMGLLMILTTLLGLIGGLLSILRIIVPYIVQGIFMIHARCTRRNQQQETRVHIPFSFQAFIRKYIEKLRQLNIFPSLPPSNDIVQIKTELISTRIFILLLIVSVLVLTIYSARTSVLKTVTFTSPSVNEYLSLYADHSDTLVCPCTKISITHENFITLVPTFHQVCSSTLIDPDWSVGIIFHYVLDTLNARDEIEWYDFRLLGGSFFYTINIFCDIAKSTMSSGLTDFNGLSLISKHVIPQNELIAQGFVLMNSFIESTTNEFINALQVIRETTQANFLVSGHGTNIHLSLAGLDGSQDIRPVATYVTLFNCSCATSSSCSAQAGLYNNETLFYSIPDVRVGCFIVEAALQSSLLAFYNQTWLNDFRHLAHFSGPFGEVKALNSSLNRNFMMNTTIESIVKQMLIDEWSLKNVSFSHYYTQCEPVECKYTYKEMNDVTYMITTIISLIGGVNVFLQLVVPRVVGFIRRYYLKRRTTVSPMVGTIQHRMNEN